ncbi:MAG: hypothetical protein KAR87_01690 [Candidatus Aenigmarchaeota archaeon]|nr:hypothetical protein [Candidatus Aenigmarchaeota archaeon]
MNKETIKQFLKLDWKKILIFFIIPLFSSPPFTFYPKYSSVSVEDMSMGKIPAPAWGFPISDHKPPLARESVICYPIFILDLLLCYLIGCLVIFSHKQFKIKK